MKSLTTSSVDEVWEGLELSQILMGMNMDLMRTVAGTLKGKHVMQLNIESPFLLIYER